MTTKWLYPAYIGIRRGDHMTWHDLVKSTWSQNFVKFTAFSHVVHWRDYHMTKTWPIIFTERDCLNSWYLIILHYWSLFLCLRPVGYLMLWYHLTIMDHQRSQCPLMKLDRHMAAMESQLGYLSWMMVGEKANQWVSTDARFIHCQFLMITGDSWNKTWGSLQCVFLSPLSDYIINSPAQYTIEYTPKMVHSNRTTLSTWMTALSAGSCPHRWDPFTPPRLWLVISARLRA